MIRVLLHSAFAPVEVSLTIDGNPVTLDANNQASFTETVIGQHNVEAIITDANDTVTIHDVFTIIDDSDTDNPIAIITTLDDDAEITAPIVLTGTADDENLLHYTVTVVSRDNRGFSQEIIRSTTPVIDGELATLDPTQLLNGLYTPAFFKLVVA